MNQVSMTGRIVADAKAVREPTADKVGTFAITIACDAGKNEKGEPITYFFDVYGSYRSKEWFSHLRKGLCIAFSGYLFYIDKTDKEGKKHRNFALRAMNLEYVLPPKEKAEEAKATDGDLHF